MVCIACRGKTEVYDTISLLDNVYRKRKCLECGAMFYTNEVMAPEEQVRPLFTEWSRERGRACRAKKKGFEYEPQLSVERDDGNYKPKSPAKSLF